MSNERIDLTQFEGMTKQSLALRGVIYVGDGASIECGLDDPRCQTIDIGNVARMNEDRLGYVKPAYAEEQWSKTLATARLFSEAPDLIAELKRCYERIDSLEERIEWMEHVSSGIHEEDWANQVREWLECAHPSKWCSWGDCPKCASE